MARLRLIGIAEGLSFLLLLGVAMPLKYWAGLPLAVTVVGWLHGVLFTGYCVSLAEAAWRMRWPPLRSAALFLAALLPLGPFLMAPRLEREAASAG